MTKSKQTIIYLILLSIIGYVLNILFHKYLTNHMEVELYGDFCIGLNILEIIVNTLLLGTAVSVMKFMPTLEKPKKEKEFINWNFNFLKKPLLFYILFLLIFLITLNIYQFQNQELMETLHISVLMLFIAPFAIFYTLFLAYLNSKNELISSSFMDSTARNILLLTLFIFMFSIFHKEVNTLLIVSIYIISYSFLTWITIKIYESKYEMLNPFKYIFKKICLTLKLIKSGENYH